MESVVEIILNGQLSNETVGINQEQFSVLFHSDQSVLSRHWANVFKERYLNKESNMQKMHIANSDKPVALNNKDVIISVGHLVKSIRDAQFRQWATQVTERLSNAKSIDARKMNGNNLHKLAN